MLWQDTARPTRVRHKSVKQECPTRVTQRSVIRKSVKQECPRKEKLTFVIAQLERKSNHTLCPTLRPSELVHAHTLRPFAGLVRKGKFALHSRSDVFIRCALLIENRAIVT